MSDRTAISKIYHQGLLDLVQQASQVHSESFPHRELQLSRLLSIKTGGCPENCAYCPQSAHYQTGVEKQKLMSLPEVLAAAKQAQQQGATRFCMGAAWREVRDGPEFDRVLEMVSKVKNTGLEVCCTLGMLTPDQAQRLKQAGLYAYNHNIDSSRDFYSKVISTRTYDDRLQTIANVRSAGITVCTGGILGMGETHDDRIDFLQELQSLSPHPESVTINALIPIKGTPLSERPSVAPLDLVRVIATARILMPNSMIRLSAGRTNLTEEAQFLCFLSGVSSIFMGDRLLTSSNPEWSSDEKLLETSGLAPQRAPIEEPGSLCQ